MNVPWSQSVPWSLTTVATLLTLCELVAMERARAYGLAIRPLRVSAILPGSVALMLTAFLAAHGAAQWPRAVLVACAAVSATTDVQTGYVFDRVLIVSAALLIAGTLLAGRIEDALLGAAVAGGALLLPWLCSRGRGMGLGDVKLAAVLGLGLGSASAFAAIWFSALSGGAAAAILLALRRGNGKTEMRFAPFLALGACYALVRAAR